MCLHHMVYKPSEEKRKKAINWGLMIITLNLIQPGLRALWLHVRQGERHVRVSRWAPWVDILCEPPPPQPVLFYLWRNKVVSLFTFFFLLQWYINFLWSETYQTHASKATSPNNVHFIWVSRKQHTDQTISFQGGREGETEEGERVLWVNMFWNGFKAPLRTFATNVNSSCQTFEKHRRFQILWYS